MNSIAALRRRLRQLSNPADASFLQGFFKTAPGEYGAGDRFLGIRVPELRRLVREYDGPLLTAARSFVRSPYHEERLLGLLMLVRAFSKSSPAERAEIYRWYLANARFVNNWDLVDLSAPQIVGPHLATKSRRRLERLARSGNIWERRIAVVATLHFIRQDEFEPTLELSALLLKDPHDLIHKATGWMLREVGKRDQAALEGFLVRHAAVMPRTMLRYAIERFPPRLRATYLRQRAERARED